MTLDIVSTKQYTDTSVKSSGRSAGTGDTSENFSGTLSKLGRDGSAGEEGDRGKADSAGAGEILQDHDSVGSRPGMRTHAGSILSMEEQLNSGSAKRGSIADVFGNAKGNGETSPAKKNLKDEPDWPSAGHPGAVDADTSPQDKNERPGTSSTGNETTDILAMLAGQAGQKNSTAIGTTDRATLDGKKADGGRGRDAVAMNAAGSTADPSDALDMPTDDIELQRRPLRFVNARDGSLNGDIMAVANARERSVDGKAGSAGADNVLVLDSRRFLGLAPNSNSSSLLASMVADPEWSTSMRAGSTQSSLATGTATSSVVHMLKLQMNPHNLGMVTATLRLVGEELHVHLTVETRAAHRQLSADSAGMLDALKSHGFSVDQVTINIASNTDTSSQKGQQDPQMGQQMPGNGERNSGSSDGQSGTRFAGEMSGDGDVGGELGADDRTHVGSGEPRTGQLYL